MKTGRRFKRDMFKPSVLGRMLGGLLHRGRREASRQAKALQAPAMPRRRDFVLEMMEPRVLMSADIAYMPTLAASTVTVSASTSGGSVFIDVAQRATSLAHRQLSAAGDVTVNIASLGQATAETVRFKLDTFSVLNSFVNANGGVLTLDLANGSEVLFDDHVFLDGSAAALDFRLKLHTSADLTIGAKASFKGNLTLVSDDTITGKCDDRSVRENPDRAIHRNPIRWRGARNRDPGQREKRNHPDGCPLDRVRRPGAGRQIHRHGQ